MIELLDLSDEWQSFTPLELFEKFECHAEALLTDSTFLSTLEGWPGLQELKSFTNQNWWKRRSRAQQRHNRPGQRQASQESCTESQSMDTLGFDLSQEESNLEAETAAVEFHGKTGRKGTSSLRPRLPSVLHTPGTPTRRDDSDSDVLDVGKVSSDDDCQIIEPKNFSLGFKTKSSNKRVLGEDPSANASKRPRKTRNEAATRNPRNRPSLPFKFGRGRPALTTVPVHPLCCHFSDDRSQSPLTPSTRRLFVVPSHDARMSRHVRGQRRLRRKSTNITVYIELKFEML